MASMKEFMERCAPVGTAVELTLVRGTEEYVRGQILSYEEEFLILAKEPQRQKRLYRYDVIGTFDVLEEPAPYNAAEEAAEKLITDLKNAQWSLESLMAELKQALPDAYRSYSSVFQRLSNAIKIKEVAAKFNRTPGVSRELEKLAEETGGHEVVLALIGALALVSDDEAMMLRGLTSLDELTRPTEPMTVRLRKEICELSCALNNFTVLTHLLTNAETKEQKQNAAAAALFCLKKEEINVVLPDRSDLLSSANLSYLREMTQQRSQALSSKPVRQSPPPAEEQVGYIICYITQSGNGFLAAESAYKGISTNRGELSFQSEDLESDVALDTRRNHYKVSYQVSGAHAYHIKVLETIPKPLNLSPDSVTDAIGYIKIYLPQKNLGYLSLEEEYDKNLRGDVLFYKSDIEDLKESLDTYHFHYKVSCQVHDYGPETKKRAVNIRILERISINGQQPTLSHRTGYIIFYQAPLGRGYIVGEDQYGKTQKGDIFFTVSDLEPGVSLDTFHYHYKVAFDYSVGLTKRAYNIRIIEKILPGAPAPMEEFDIGKYQLRRGETIVIEDRGGQRILGEYESHDEQSLTLVSGSETHTLALDSVAALYFFGEITSYNMLNSTGAINGQLNFRISNVVSKELAHNMNSGKYRSFICIYSLSFEGNSYYINTIDYIPLSSDLMKSRKWKSGRITSQDDDKNVILIEDSVKGYLSSAYTDGTIGHYSAEHLLAGREVFYKSVSMQIYDALGARGMQECALDFKLQEYPASRVNASGTAFHCGGRVISCFESILPIPASLRGKDLTVTLALDPETENLLVERYALPQIGENPQSGAAGTLRPSVPPTGESQVEEDDELDSSGAAPTTLLEFVLEQFDPQSVQTFLDGNDQALLRDRQYLLPAHLEQTLGLLNELSSCNSKKSKYFDVDKQEKPTLFLAAAKISYEYRRVNGVMEKEPALLSAEKMHSNLYRYSYNYVLSGRVRAVEELSYHSQSVLENQFRESAKAQIIARCLFPFFSDAESRRKFYAYNFKWYRSLKDILYCPCVDPDGLMRMLLSFPQETFSLLIQFIGAENFNNTDLLKQFEKQLGLDPSDRTQPRAVRVADRLNVIRISLENQKKWLVEQLSSGVNVVNNLNAFFDTLEQAEDSFRNYLLAGDIKNLRITKDCLNDLQLALPHEDANDRVYSFQSVYLNIRSCLSEIERAPSCFSFEILRPFLLCIKREIANYLNEQYRRYAPRLTAVHYTLSDSRKREILSVSNEPNYLRARNVRVTATPYRNSTDFYVDDQGSRMIEGQNQTVDFKKAVEIRIPIVIRPEVRNELEMEVVLSYEYNVSFDEEFGRPLSETAQTEPIELQIPIQFDPRNTLRPEDNPYSSFAGGDPMKPNKDNARRMFYGREEDILEVYRMLVDRDGKLKRGSITALYGQKRCGKTSVMNFLGQKIQENHPNAIILSCNAQGITADPQNPNSFFTGLLMNICTQFKTTLIRNRDLNPLLRELSQKQLNIPLPSSLSQPGGDALFSEFFQLFNAHYGETHPVVVMVDEFTQAYVHMKRHLISEDFLNRWRAMVQENELINIIVGQDFMDQFTLDPEIAAQNFGGSVNGLGTMKKKRLSYLTFENARKMIEEPVFLKVPIGSSYSRYRGQLGEAAIRRIYELTGGSAFYLMKFLNCLTDYMIENREQLVTLHLVNTVATDHVFTTSDNPITKADFDPIFNEFSIDQDRRGDSETELGQAILQRTDKTYQLLKEIALHSNSRDECDTDTILWEDEAEKQELLRSLAVRGVLSDADGHEIKKLNAEHLKVKIKVGLFKIWLQQRG